MFFEASEMGRRPRHRLHLSSEADGLAAARIVYGDDRDRLPLLEGRGGIDTEMRVRLRVRPRHLPADVVDRLGLIAGLTGTSGLRSRTDRRRCGGVSRARASRRRRRETSRNRRRERCRRSDGRACARGNVRCDGAGGRRRLATPDVRSPDDRTAEAIRLLFDPRLIRSIPRDPRPPNARGDGARERFLPWKDDDDGDR